MILAIWYSTLACEHAIMQHTFVQLQSHCGRGFANIIAATMLFIFCNKYKYVLFGLFRHADVCGRTAAHKLLQL
jgi:hypothetical protein